MNINKKLVVLLKIGAVMLTALVLLALTVIIISAGMVGATREKIFSHENIDTLTDESYDYILVLGAGVKSNGQPTDMLRDRIIVGAELYLSGVADKIIMSGDRSGENYDEPSVMQKYAIELGVPEEDIICDFEGYSTHDSLDRFEKKYGGASVVVVSQEYHLHRAVYLCKEQGITKYCGVEADLDTYSKQPIYNFREVFARVKDFLFLN